jgi:hypothetical protein
MRIKKKLGGEVCNQVIAKIEAGRHEDAVRMLLRYYTQTSWPNHPDCKRLNMILKNFMQHSVFLKYTS